MRKIGSYEAKTHLPKLLERAARGERILITKHGRAIAMLGPPTEEGQHLDAREVISAMRALRQGTRLGEGVTLRDLIDEGRRF